MSDKVIVTPRQHDYLLVLSESPKTTRELMEHFRVSANVAYRILHKLVDKGLVASERMKDVLGNIHIYRLVQPYNKLDIMVKNYHRTGKPRIIPNEGILYAAILRNGGMTGQRLYQQFRRLFPDRSDSSIRHIVGIARNRGLNGTRLCR